MGFHWLMHKPEWIRSSVKRRFESCLPQRSLKMLGYQREMVARKTKIPNERYPSNVASRGMSREGKVGSV